MQTSLTLLAGVENRRLGRVLGDDGLARVVRSFHFRVRSVKCGGRGTARTRIAYVRREGKHAKSSADVENAAGDKDALIDAADRIEATSRIKRGPTAERILQSFVLELPAESTAAERAATAEAVVEHWRTRYGEDRPGHEAIAVVHMHGDEAAQPHLHVEVAARPILADETVDRSVRLWTDPSPSEAVKAERAAMAEIVNTWCTTKAAFHAGAFKEIGREDEGKPRLPISAWRAMRKAMRAAGDKDEADRIEAEAYAVEANRREGLREAGLARAAEIDALKAAGEWPPKSQRAALQTELNTAQADAAGWEKNTLEIVKLAYEQDGRDLPDLGTDAGLAAADEFLEGGAGRAEAVAAGRAEEREEAGRTLIDAKAAWQDERAALAAERDNAKNETSALRAHSAEQTEFLTGVHRESRRDLPDLETGEGRSAAWAFARAVMKAGREAAAEKKELEQRVAPEQLQQPADEALRYFTAAEREAAETRQRKAEAKKAKRGEQSEKEKADGEISEACKPVYRMWKQTGDKIGRALADGGGLAAAAEAYGQYHGSPLSLRKDATEEKLAGVLAAINAAAARLGAETLKRPLTVEEAAAEYEQRRPKTPIEQVAASGAAALAAEEEERLRPAKELAAEKEVRASWNLGWRSPAPASGKSRLQTPPRAVEPEPAPVRQVQPPKLEGERQQKVPDPPARPWKDLSDDELVNHWGGASRRRHRAGATDEQKAGERRKIEELHAEAKHRNTTLKTLDAQKRQREGRGGGMEM